MKNFNFILKYILLKLACVFNKIITRGSTNIIVIKYQNTSHDLFSIISTYKAFCFLYKTFLQSHLMTNNIQHKLKIFDLKYTNNDLCFELIVPLSAHQYTSFINRLVDSCENYEKEYLDKMFVDREMLLALRSVYSLLKDKDDSKLSIGVKCSKTY